MRRILLAVFVAGSCHAAQADGLSVDSNFIDTSSQSPTLCIHFNEALKPGLDAHYEDYVSVDQFTGIVAQVSGDNLCIGGIPFEKHYAVTLQSGLPAQNGDTLDSTTTINFAPGDRPPLVAISGNGLYLAKRSAGGLAITSVNIKKIALHVLRLNDLNAIQDFAASQNSNVFDPTQQTLEGDQITTLTAGQAGIIWSGSMAVADQPDTAVQTLFPIATAIGQSADRMAARPGVYLVVAEDAATAVPSGFWTGTLNQNETDTFDADNFATHWVIVTDLGLTALTGDDGIHIGVRSVSTAAPDSGITLNLISQGGDILTTVTTDASGNAFIPKALIDGTLANTPLAIAAYSPDGDFSYLPLDRAAFDLSDRGVTGRSAPSIDDAFIFADRGIYRPGETVHATLLLRDANGTALPNQKLTLGLVRADSVQVATLHVTTDEAGGVTLPVPLPANALHGQWTLQATIDPTLPPIGQLTLDVENFQPADLRITATGAPAFAAPGTALSLQATGTYLYGAPASNLPVQASITLTTDSDPIPNVTGYSFGLLNDKPADAETDIPNNGADSQGKITLQATLPTPPATTVPLRARVDIGYLEPSGALTKSEQIIKLTTTPDLIGIKPLFQGGSVNSGAPALFDIAAFTPVTGALIPATGLQERIVRTDEVFDWVGNSGTWTWRNYTVDHPVELGKLDLPGTNPLQFSRTLPDGDYTLILSDPQTGAATSFAFTVGWSGISTAASTPDTLTLTSDHTVLTPGGTATVKITGPFAGQADLYVANNQLYTEQQLAIPTTGATATITATPNWNGGAYVIADLHRGSASAPGHASVRAIGLGWIGLDPTPHTLGVQVQAPAQILPRTHQTVTVKITNAAPGQPVHLVLDTVDEGILGLTKYQTPDPAGWFWGQRKLGLEIRDIFGDLLNDQGSPGAIEQGGDEGSGGPRLPLQSTKLFATATADLTVGPDGTVQIPLDIPDFEGQARLSAVAWSLTGAGSGSSDMIVRDPVVMMPGLPSFLSTGDAAAIPVTLTNISAAPGPYTLTVKPQGLTLATPTPLQFTLAANEEKTLRIPVTAGAPGIASLDLILTNASGLTINRPFTFAIRAAHPPALVSLFGAIHPGTTLAIPPQIAASAAPTGTARLAAAGFPGLDTGTLLAALAADVDDTDTVTLASNAFPLLDPATAAAYPGGPAAAQALINSTLTTIINRQSMTGDIGDWSFDDAGSFDDWVTDYAMDFLFTAQASGYPVPQVVLDRSTGWLRSEAADLTQVVADQGSAYGSEAPAPFPSFVYTEWLLARTGRADISALRVVSDALTQAQTPDNKPLVFWGGGNTPDHLAAPGDLAKLALALQLSGDTARATRVLGLASTVIGAPGQNAWAESFWWTENQDVAIVLYAAATLGDQTTFDKAAIQLDPATLVQNQDEDSIAWLLRAASAGNHQAATTGSRINLLLAGKPQTLPLPGAITLPWADVMKATPIQFLTGTGYYAFTAHYTPTTPAAPFAHGMTLTVTYQDLSGHTLNPNALHQGQEVAVLISGAVPGDDVHDLNIAALLPACFAIDKTMPGPQLYAATLSTPQSYSSDVDRFLATVQLGTPDWESDTSDDTSGTTPPQPPPGHFAVAYLAKVTTVGTFTLPEVTVRDRVHPAITAGSGSQSITVLP